MTPARKAVIRRYIAQERAWMGKPKEAKSMGCKGTGKRKGGKKK